MSGRIAVLMTCHNRSDTTLACLAKLLPLLGDMDRVYLVDDGSRDGTTEAVIGLNDSRIHVIEGNGSLYWAKGMNLAWRESVKSCEKYDYFLWINDDVELKTDSIANLQKDHELTGCKDGVIVGTCATDDTEQFSSYGATDLDDRRYFPNSQGPVRAEGWFNGNVVLVPNAAYEKIGMISGDYSHAKADYDYAERLKRAGIPFFASSHFVGVCHNDFRLKMSGLGLWQRMRMFFKPGYWNLADLFRFRRRYWGLPRAVLSVCHLVFQVVFRSRGLMGIVSRVEHEERVEGGRDSEPCRTCRELMRMRVERVER